MIIIIVILWLIFYSSCKQNAKSTCIFRMIILRIQLFDRLHIRQIEMDDDLDYNSKYVPQGSNKSKRNNVTHNNTRLHCNNVWFPTDLPWLPVSGIDQRIICLFSVIQSSSLLEPSNIHSLWLKHFKNSD